MSELKNRLLNIETQAKNKDVLCVVGILLEELDEETRQVLERVLRSSASTRSIWLELRASGYRVDRVLLRLHRIGKCNCVEGDVK